ncbi:MAG: hypothetical protein SXA11_03605 [Cyanobacteriota bacterium]|nr:hypothetical protein [Cyanobacteriota bacterium]
MRHAAIAPREEKKALGAEGNLFPQIKAIVPKEIKIEKLEAIGAGKIPLLVYATPKGRCSTFLSKAQFLTCLESFLAIKQQKFCQVTGYEIRDLGVAMETETGKYFVVYSEIKAFLERYNRVALDGLEVELTGISAVVRNGIKGTVTEVNKFGCNCADAIYRRTICKHQIAAELHLTKLGLGSLEEYLKGREGTKWEDKFLAINN